MFGGFGIGRRLAQLALVACACIGGTAMAADIQVSQYSFSPDPVANTGVATFSVRLTNNGPQTVSDARLQIAVSSRFQLSSADVPAYCTVSGSVGAQTVSCNLPTLAVGSSTLTYTATARQIGSADTTATISSVSANDPNTSNNSLTITPTVINGADMTVSKTDNLPGHRTASGGTISYTLTANNAGPADTNAVRLTDNLPSSDDFDLVSAAGTGWTCGSSGQVVTCDYGGAALTGAYPAVTITGRVVSATTGTITNNAFVGLNSPLVGDPNPNNNAAAPVVTTIDPGTDLAATKSMPSRIAVGETVTVTVGVQNIGPQDVNGATVTDAVPSSLTVVSVPTGCTLTGQTVVCTTGYLPQGATQTFAFTVRGASVTSGNVGNVAVAATPAGTSDPNPSNDQAIASYQIQGAGADLSIDKIKTPSLVGPGDRIRNFVSIINNGPASVDYTPANPLRFVDTVSADESYQSVDSPWTCNQSGLQIICTLAGPGTLQAGAGTPVISLYTVASATANGALTNTACTGTTGGSTATPLDTNPANDCISATNNATAAQADLSIDKTVSLSPGSGFTHGVLTVPGTASSFYIKLVATNNSTTASTAVVTDPIAGYFSGGAGTTALSEVDATGAPLSSGTVSFAANGTLTWNAGTLAANTSASLIVKVTRPLDGSSATLTNTATIASTDVLDSNPANNSSAASYVIAPVADVAVTQKTISPNPAQVGVVSTYTISTRNNGPNEAEGVTLTDTIDTTRFDMVGQPSTTKGDGSCSLTNGATSATINCSLGAYPPNTSYQVLQQVRPRFPFGGSTSFPQSYTNTATIASTSTDSDATNNTQSVTHDVIAPELDLAISKQEPGPQYDPVSYGDELVYDIRVSNFGPSQANNVVVVDTPQPPSGYVMNFAGYSVNPVAASSGLTLYTPPNPSCVASGGTITCKLDAGNAANNFLRPLYQSIFRVRFTTAGAAPSGSLTFTDTAAVTANEQPTTTTTLGDPQLANNVATQTTTVLPASDLEVVSKSRISSSPAAVGVPIEYRIVIRNNGLSPTSQVRVTDDLPPGFVLATPAASAVASGTSSVSAISCTNSAAAQILCVLDGTFSPDGSLVTITLYVKAADPYSGARGSDLTNTATISPGIDPNGNPRTVDSVSTNNSKTATVQIASTNASTLSGYVFLDANTDNVVQSGEGLNGVTVTLTGVDGSNNPIGPLTTTTNSAGFYSFAGLPAGTYTLIETQPSGIADGRETANATIGGTVNNSAFDATAAHNTISDIHLPAATDAPNYLFQELPAPASASIAGRVFVDPNGDNIPQTGEGLAGVTITLSGIDANSNPIAPLTTTTDASGNFLFSNLAPGTYAIVESQPAAYFDGRETVGGAGSSQSGTANNTAFGSAPGTNTISGITLALGTAATNYLFQELPPASVTGSIYADTNNNGTRDTGENGFPPNRFASQPQLRITGTDYAGRAVNETASVDADGHYVFSGLPPSDNAGYTVTELVEPTGTIDGIDRNGTTIVAGSAGRTAPESIAVGYVAPGAVLPDRDFGELPEPTLTGSIYLDTNGDAARQGSETAGLAGGVIRLTGTDDVGRVVDCSITTGADGAFSFPNAADATLACRTLRPGSYTLTETPPAGFTHTGAFIGSAGGRVGGTSGANTAAPGAGNLAISGIALSTSGATNYNFGERGQGLTGYVYVDRNNNGLRDAGEPGIAGVNVTLSGQTISGQDVCTVVTCTATTGAGGDFAFANLPGSGPAGYTLTEQPQGQAPLAGYGDGQDGAGTVGSAVRGTAGNDVISGITLGAGELGTDYRFGERAGSLTGHVFVDANDDGVFQNGETGIAGVTLTLSGTTLSGQEICAQRAGQSPALPCTVTSGSDGAYAFADLPAGTYTLIESQPTGYADGREGAGSPAGSVNNASFGAAAATNSIGGIALGGGVAGTGYDFGERNVSIGGRVFKDPQRDGIDSGGEPGIAGVTIRLLQGSTVVATTTTAADGSYSFTGLQLGTYTVSEEQPAGYGSSSPNNVDVTLTGTAQTVNFAETVSTLAGAVFIDTSGDGVRQPGERGIAGVTVTLTGTDQAGTAVTRTTTTGADGAFRFDDLLAGTYTVVETQPTAYADGLDSAGSAGGSVGNDVIGAILLPGGVDAVNYGFGERGQILSGSVYIDANLDGTRDGEAGIAGVTITLQRADGSIVATALTAADGSYSFSNLDLGAYVVIETQPAGYLDAAENAANRVAVTIGTAPAPAINFGERSPQALGGTVYVDTNLNGKRDAGESGIGGVAVTLQRPDGSVVKTTNTAADGTYRFTDLDPGPYVVVETQPAGYLDAAENPGNRATATIDATGPPTINFGERGQSLGGFVYIDADLNGTRGSGDSGIAGVTVTLQKPDGTVVATTTTAADGSYSFTGLATGDYVVLETQPAGYGDAAENSSNRVPVTIGAAPTTPVNFGEKVGSIAGLVYDDSNFNGRRDTNEPVIRGVTVTLTGTDALGNAITRTAVTGIDGTYLITGVPGGSYTLNETQPAGYQDERDTPGTAGGIAAPVPGDMISGITLGPAQDATGYLFGERGQGAQLSGSVWFDANHDGIRQTNEPGKAGWTVQLLLGDVIVATTTTDANGYYKFDDLPPGTGYNLMFREPASAVAFGGARPNETGLPASDGVFSQGNPGGATFTVGQLRSITLNPGANVEQQSLPLDPSGILFDTINCTPIAGATVTFSGPPGFDPALHLLGGAANVAQVTGSEGFYQFLLLPGAPSGVYSLSVKAPPGGIYSSVSPSTQFPAQPGVLQVGPLPNPLLVSPNAPVCGSNVPAPYYYLSFNLTAGVSADVLNNNIPLDPILKGAIVVTKTTPMKNVTRGGLVPYTITARNALGGIVPNVAIVDNVPAGFRYRDGSARMDGVPIAPTVNGRQLTFPATSFAVNQTRTIDLILTVGAGVGEGEHVNQAWAANPAANTLVSNVAEATVRLEPDADFDCSDIIGKVFDDKNGNGYEDAGERGLAGVRVATVAGDLITTDAEGRYHITCPMIPNEDRGSNFILKLDTRTLPTGYRLTSENPETVRLTRGKVAKLNFGAALLRVVRLDVRDTVFTGDEVAPDYRARIDALVTTLESEPSVLRIVYTAHGEDAGLVRRRLAAIKASIERRWGDQKGRYRLIVETEQAP